MRTFPCQQPCPLRGRSYAADWDDHGRAGAVNPMGAAGDHIERFTMDTGKTLLLAVVLAAAPFTVSVASAQSRHPNTTSATMQPRDGASTNRNLTDQRDMRDRDMRDRDMHDRDHRDMRHYGWRRGHHYGWRHCMRRWHHHHRVRVCR